MFLCIRWPHCFSRTQVWLPSFDKDDGDRDPTGASGIGLMKLQRAAGRHAIMTFQGHAFAA